MKRIVLIILMITITLTTFTACFTRMSWENIPYHQPNTTWMSEDGTIVFIVYDLGHATGTMIVEGETMEIWLLGYQDRGMSIYPISVAVEGLTEPNLDIEYWSNYYANENTYIVEVRETTYFEEGQKIVFHRVDNDD